MSELPTTPQEFRQCMLPAKVKKNKFQFQIGLADRRQRGCRMLSLPKVTVLAVISAALAVGCRAQAAVEPAPNHSDVSSSPTRPAKSLPEPFASVLPEINAKSRIPILLPSELSQPIRGAKHAVVERASDNEYAITLYYELGIGDAGFQLGFPSTLREGDQQKAITATADSAILAGRR
jgi:hypothetical protein